MRTFTLDEGETYLVDLAVRVLTNAPVLVRLVTSQAALETGGTLDLTLDAENVLHALSERLMTETADW